MIFVPALASYSKERNGISVFSFSLLVVLFSTMALSFSDGEFPFMQSHQESRTVLEPKEESSLGNSGGLSLKNSGFLQLILIFQQNLQSMSLVTNLD